MSRVATEQLSLKSLESLGNGELGILFRNQLMRVARDCLDRPGDPTARKVSIDVIVVPVIDAHGQFVRCDAKIECKAKVPTFRSPAYQLGANMNGFLFNREFPDSINQMSLLDDPGEGDDDDGEIDDQDDVPGRLR